MILNINLKNRHSCFITTPKVLEVNALTLGRGILHLKVYHTISCRYNDKIFVTNEHNCISKATIFPIFLNTKNLNFPLKVVITFNESSLISS